VADRRLTLSADDSARIRAVEAIVAAGGERAVGELIARLGDSSWAVRRSVVAGLAQLGPVGATAMTASLRDHRDDETRLAALVDALSASRGDIDPIVLALADGAAAPPVLCDVAQIMGRRHSPRALPLLARLTAHADDNVAVAAVEALGRIGGDAGIDALIALAASGNFFRVFPTIEVLGRSGDARAVPALLALLGNPLFAADAARALGRTGDERAAPALAAMLGATTLAGVRAAALAIAELHERRRERYGHVDELDAVLERAAPAEAPARLCNALHGADAAEQRAIAQALGWLGGDEAIAGLFGLLGEGTDATVAAAAAAALKRLKGGIDAQLGLELRAGDSAHRLTLLPLTGGRAVHADDVIACLDDRDASVRVAACEALARISDTRALPRLFAQLGDADARAAQAAVGAIQSLGSAEAERLTLAAARSPELTVRRAAYRIIAYFGYPSGLDVLLEGARDPDPRLKETAIAGLAFIEDERALATLLAARHDPAAKTRAAAVRALGQCEAQDATRAALHEALADADAWVRYYACQALGRQRDEGSTPLLVACLADPAGQVRVAAVEALARRHHPEAIAALSAALGSPDADVRRAALVGLGQSQRPEAVPILLDALAAPDASTRLVVVSALAVFDTPDVVRALARAAADADESVRSAAVELLSARPGVLVTQLLAGLVDAPALRERVGRTLSTPTEGRVEGLVAALEHADGEQAILLAGSLARLARPDAEAALVQLVRGGALPARRAAAEALRSVHSPLAREALEAAATHDPDASVRRAAALALED
jgi:HEAT repeat protein